MNVADLVTMDDAAERLGVSVRTVTRYQHEGKLPTVHVGRSRFTTRKDLERFARQRERETVA